ncbi:uncharacterized protein LOC132203915 [Neocloeon triangulifer]|uniref:uncharacterized protein LOC132203915 n=1 Tax=Neocloeon triangulifer TaxID=2078957 RepID=UPI00286F2086|nr:uncharacterized protein LOC132203915 [Neocloeon triangulifer]
MSLSAAYSIVLLGLSLQAGSGATSTLTKDFHKFLDVVTFEDFVSPFLHTYQENEQFARSADFLVSQRFNDLLDELIASVYFEEYRNLLMEHGVPAQLWLEKARAMTHKPPFPVPHPAEPEKTAALDKDFMPFIYNMMPYFILTDIRDVYFYVSRTSVPFMDLLQFLASDEYKNTLSFLVECPQYQALIDTLQDNGIDVLKIYNYLKREFELADDY